jgi:adenosine deaminase
VAGAKSIWEALEILGVERIGHGVRAHEDPKLVGLLKERQIPLEMCVISNVKTGVCNSVKTHPVRRYFDEGLMVTVNSDDPTMFNTSIAQEYLALVHHLHFTLDEIKKLTRNTIDASFMPDGDKKSMRSRFEVDWGAAVEE